jgi:hypothetical protein
MPAVRSDWKKSRALDWLLEHVEIVDEEGQPVDRSLLDPGSLTADPENEADEVDEADAPEDQETGES